MSFNWNGKTIYYPNERINNSRIQNACDKILETAEKLNTSSQNIKTIADKLNNDKVLYVNHQAYSKNLYDYSEELDRKYKGLKSVCTAVKKIAKRQYDTEESDYSAYLEYKKQQEELERQQELERRRQNKMENY